MKINGIIAGKLISLDTVLAELQSLGKISVLLLEKNWQMRRAVERDLQVLIEIVIDICQRLLVLTDHQPAPTSAEVIAQCEHLGIISHDPNYRFMVQFRNFIVHRYETVDPEILCDIVNSRLKDVIKFKREIQEYVKQN